MPIEVLNPHQQKEKPAWSRGSPKTRLGLYGEGCGLAEHQVRRRREGFSKASSSRHITLGKAILSAARLDKAPWGLAGLKGDKSMITWYC
jgi:hypothetical protein